jgi:uncharacterized protein YndB with AHSA1/START domain
MTTVPTVVQRYDVSCERVFDAWLDVKCLAKFAFGPGVREEQIVRLGIDARVGGTFSFTVRRGGHEIEFNGQYLAIERPSRLAFTWRLGRDEAPRPVQIDIRRVDTGCELTLTGEPAPRWTEILQNLVRVLGRDKKRARL